MFNQDRSCHQHELLLRMRIFSKEYTKIIILSIILTTKSYLLDYISIILIILISYIKLYYLTFVKGSFTPQSNLTTSSFNSKLLLSLFVSNYITRTIKSSIFFNYGSYNLLYVPFYLKNIEFRPLEP